MARKKKVEDDSPEIEESELVEKKESLEPEKEPQAQSQDHPKFAKFEKGK